MKPFTDRLVRVLLWLVLPLLCLVVACSDYEPYPDAAVPVVMAPIVITKADSGGTLDFGRVWRTGPECFDGPPLSAYSVHDFTVTGFYYIARCACIDDWYAMRRYDIPYPSGYKWSEEKCVYAGPQDVMRWRRERVYGPLPSPR
jgi:hypothetical protein